MKRAWIGAAAVGLAAALASGPAPDAGAQKPSIKQMMGENFAGLQTILAALITSKYDAVPHQLAVIQDHAEQLMRNVPESAEGQRDKFLGYAYNLKAHASDLNSIIGLLMEHDRTRKTPEGLPTDQLREAAAAHYGGMVTTCVSCHNRFRRRVVSPGGAGSP